jgi:hypothetical protein
MRALRDAAAGRVRTWKAFNKTHNRQPVAVASGALPNTARLLARNPDRPATNLSLACRSSGPLTRGLLNLGQHRVQFIPLKHPSGRDHRPYSPGVADVLQRVRVKEHEIRPHAGCDRSQIRQIEGTRRIPSRSLENLHLRQARLHEQ